MNDAACAVQRVSRRSLHARPKSRQLIAGTTASTELTVYARLDPGSYPKRDKVSDTELAAVNIDRDTSHGEWNYRLDPVLTGVTP